jgi:hypothetical protein
VNAPFDAYDRVQLAMSRNGEDAARAFYAGVCGMTEIEKPEPLRACGGVWFASGSVALHAHPALCCRLVANE